MTPMQRRVVVWFAAVCCVGLTARLGVWQLSRADEKQRAHDLMVQREAQAPWQNADWPCEPGLDPASLPLYQPVRLRGQWLADKTVYLDNRPMDSASGFVVVTPLRLSGGAVGCLGRIVLVERGWLPRDAQDRLRLPALPHEVGEAGEVQVSGQLIAGLSRTYQLGEEPDPAGQSGPLLRQNADQGFWRRWLGQAPIAGAVQQVQGQGAPAPVGVGTGAAAPVLRRDWAVPGLGRDRHLAYAFQWFALSALFAALTFWFQILKPRRAQPHVPA